MKTFKFIGTGLMALCLSFSLTACSDDDPENPPTDKNENLNGGGIVTKGKKLIGIKEVLSDVEHCNYDFYYDSKGRIASIVSTDYYNGQTYIDRSNYTWHDNMIVETTDRSNDTTRFRMNGNLIYESYSSNEYNADRCTFEYGNDNRLTKSEETYYSSSVPSISYMNLTWNNNRLVRVNVSEDNGMYKSSSDMQYDGTTCKGYFPLYAWFTSDGDELFLAHPELVGLHCNQLPKSVVSTSSEEQGTDVQSMKYTFDKDGYVQSCTLLSTDDTDTYYFTWK